MSATVGFMQTVCAGCGEFQSLSEPAGHIKGARAHPRCVVAYLRARAEVKSMLDEIQKELDLVEPRNGTMSR